MTKPLIYFVAVNYNNAAYSLKYVKSVLSLKSDFNVQVIIVDNKSEVEDIFEIEKGITGLDNVKLIKNPVNSGYFKGLNKGLETFDTSSAAFVLIGNNDLEFDADFLQLLKKIEFDNHTMILAPDVVTENGIHQNPLCIKRMHPLRKWGLRIYYTNYYFGKTIYHLTQLIKNAAMPNRKLESSEFIYMGIGACYVLTPNFFKSFSLLKEDVFLWSEEALLAGQITEKNGKTLYCSQLIVHHAENTSIKKLPSRKTYAMARESFLKTFRYY
ncbi:MAG: glycosyltransferase [Bacteroidota bacterium]